MPQYYLSSIHGRQLKQNNWIIKTTLMLTSSLEIDFLDVNSGEKSGDAIAFRYGDFSNAATQKVVVIDGGTLDSGQRLVTMIKEVYNTTKVDLVICTHPDGDHASGLREILNELTVGELWLHKPWDHSEHIHDLFDDGRITPDSLDERLREAYDFAHQLEIIATEKGVAIREPFAGREFDNGVIRVLGPTIDYYRELIPDFTKSPEAAKSLMEKAYSGIKKAIAWIRETIEGELLDESGVTSAENNSSAVVMLMFQEHRYLFTGDAGIEGLKKVIEYASSEQIDLKNLKFLQVPHHGSKRNVSPTVLNEIKCLTAYISAAKDSEKHPSRKVINALTRRKSEVYSTEGKNLLYSINGIGRIGYGPITAHPFYNEVQE